MGTTLQITKLILLGLMILLMALIPARAAKRIALVIGNDAYLNVAPLEKAVNDSRTMASALSDVGFQVIAVENASRRDMNRALLNFASQLELGDEALFFMRAMASK